jgi:rhodanese-related sulfurtransferase
VTVVQELTVEEVKARIDAGEALRLVDVRENDEWAQGRIQGAQHIPKGCIERDIATAIEEQDAPIVLYCAGGFRSAASAEVLQRMGYRQVFSMKGGLKAWIAGRYPVVS